MTHGNVDHWKMYRVLKGKYPDLKYKQLRHLASVMCEFELSPESEADIVKALDYMESLSKMA